MRNYDDYSWTKRERELEQKAVLKHEKQMKRELMKAANRKRKLEIAEIRETYKPDEKEKKKVSTTKLLMVFIFANCTVVEAYSMWVMYTLGDLSALYALIGAVITESISFAIYCVKAFNETKEEERLRFERDKFEKEHEGVPSDMVEENLMDDIPVEEGDTEVVEFES